MIGRQQQLFPVKDRWIRTISIGSPKRSARTKVDRDGLFECRVGAFEKTGVMQEGKAGSICAELNDVELLSDTVAFCKHSEHMSERAALARLRLAMEVDGTGQNLAVRQGPQQLPVLAPINDGGRGHLEILTAYTWPVTVAQDFAFEED